MSLIYEPKGWKVTLYALPQRKIRVSLELGRFLRIKVSSPARQKMLSSCKKSTPCLGLGHFGAKESVFPASI